MLVMVRSNNVLPLNHETYETLLCFQIIIIMLFVIHLSPVLVLQQRMSGIRHSFTVVYITKAQSSVQPGKKNVTSYTESFLKDKKAFSIYTFCCEWIVKIYHWYTGLLIEKEVFKELLRRERAGKYPQNLIFSKPGVKVSRGIQYPDSPGLFCMCSHVDYAK